MGCFGARIFKSVNNPLIKIDPTGEAEIMVRNAGPINANNLDPVQQGGHVLVNVEGIYYGFAPTADKASDVQTYDQEGFEQQYAGQTWQVYDIGTDYDQDIVAQFEQLKQNGDTEEGTYRLLTNNCTQKAIEILQNTGAFRENSILFPKMPLPNMLNYQLRNLQRAESLYGIVDRSYKPIIKDSYTIKVEK